MGDVDGSKSKVQLGHIGRETAKNRKTLIKRKEQKERAKEETRRALIGLPSILREAWNALSLVDLH
jgi:hypothetical protein